MQNILNHRPDPLSLRAPSQDNVTIREVKFAIDNTSLSVVYILLEVAYVKGLLDLSDQTNHGRTWDKEYKKGARF
jgi:hypothetical protein